jgi:hypothetical protein
MYVKKEMKMKMEKRRTVERTRENEVETLHTQE